MRISLFSSRANILDFATCGYPTPARIAQRHTTAHMRLLSLKNRLAGKACRDGRAYA